MEIQDYLSAEEIKDICKDALYQKIREDMRHMNVNTIIANISYAEVAALVDTHIGEKDFCQREISKKVRSIIENLSVFTVFRRSDAWERSSSVAQDILVRQRHVRRGPHPPSPEI